MMHSEEGRRGEQIYRTSPCVEIMVPTAMSAIAKIMKTVGSSRRNIKHIIRRMTGVNAFIIWIKATERYR